LCFRTDVSGQTDLIDISSRELKGKWVELSKVWVTRDPNVSIWLYRDGAKRVECPTNSLNSLDKENEFGIINTSRFKAELYSIASVTGYICRLGVWVFEPTIADKINMGVDLTDEEVAIATDTDLVTRFNKGLVPISRDLLVKRIFHHVNKYTKSILADLTTDGLRYNEYNPEPDQFIVIEGISCVDTSPTTVNASIKIEVDDRVALTIPCPCLSIDYDIPLFIPALDNIRIEFSTDTTITGFRARWKIGVYKLTDRIKMMWGLIGRGVNEELWKEVKAGV